MQNSHIVHVHKSKAARKKHLTLKDQSIVDNILFASRGNFQIFIHELFTYLMRANDQKRSIGGMKNTGMKFVSIAVQLMNAISFATRTKFPYFSYVVACRC